MRSAISLAIVFASLSLFPACSSDDPAGTGATGAGATTSTAGGGGAGADGGAGGDGGTGGAGGDAGVLRSSDASYTDPVMYSGSKSVVGSAVFEVMPGPAAIDPLANPTPFSDVINDTAGSYSLVVDDTDAIDSMTSTDAVTSVDIRFTGSDGTNYLIDSINVIHKADGTGAHTFFGGVGQNKVMHGDTTIGTGLMPKMLAYITLWGIVDLKDADTDQVVAAGRVVHIMTATGVRDGDKKLVTEIVTDASDHDRRFAETHVILPPLDMAGQMSPVPGTAHGFLHMMFSNVELTDASRDPTLAYEILPGPAVINPNMSPTPFSDRIAVASGSYSLAVRDFDADDATTARDVADDFTLAFRLDDGTEYTIDGIDIIHKEEGTGDHSFFGGVGYDVVMHGDTEIGTALMPKMTAYITLWGTVDIKDADGVVVAANRMVHIMVGARVRDADLALSTDTTTDTSDKSDAMVETHIILPPLDLAGQMSPIPGTRHGFLHLMFEKVNLTR